MLLPDYLVPRMNRSHGFLSFHSHGLDHETVHFKPSDFPRRVILDRGGYSGWSTLASASIEDLAIPDLEVVGRFYREHKAEIHQGNISKYNQKPMSEEVALPERFMFVALQLANDRTQALARIPMLRMLDIVIERFKRTDTTVVVKRHPKCQDPSVEARLEALRSRGDIVLTDASIHVLIPRSLGVCTVNSGVGSEAMVYLKPIYLFGEADYNWVGYLIASYGDFEDATRSLTPRRSTKDIKRFLYYYRNVYQTDIDDTERLRTRVADMLFSDTIKQAKPSRWSRSAAFLSSLRQRLFSASDSRAK